MGLDSIMFCDVPRVLDESAVRAAGVRLAVSLGGSSAVWHSPPERPCLTIVTNSTRYEDEEPIAEGSTRVGVRTLARYYGPGYERGPIVDILAVARFLRHVWHGCTVYYGSDGGGPVSVLDNDREDALWGHLFSAAGRAYYRHASSVDAVCEHDGIPLNFNMWGGGDSGASCPACRRHWVYKKNGTIIATKADYKTPADSNAAWVDVPKVEIPLWRLKAAQQASEEDPRQAPAEIEALIASASK